MIAAWPVADKELIDGRIEVQFAKFQAVLAGLREVRSRQNIAPKTPIRFSVRTDAETQALLEPMAAYFQSMAGAIATAWGADVQSPAVSANFSAAGCEVFVDLAGAHRRRRGDSAARKRTAAVHRPDRVERKTTRQRKFREPRSRRSRRQRTRRPGRTQRPPRRRDRRSGKTPRR